MGRRGTRFLGAFGVRATIAVGGASNAAAAPTAPTAGYNTICSLRPSDPKADCLVLGFGLGRARVVPGSTLFDWKLVSAGGNNYTIRDRTMNECLDIFQDSQAVDAPMNLRPCDGTQSQVWTQRVDLSAGLFGGWHPLQNTWSGLFMTFETVPGGPFGADVVIQRPFGDRASQFFGLLAPAA